METNYFLFRIEMFRLMGTRGGRLKAPPLGHLGTSERSGRSRVTIGGHSQGGLKASIAGNELWCQICGSVTLSDPVAKNEATNYFFAKWNVRLMGTRSGQMAPIAGNELWCQICGSRQHSVTLRPCCQKKWETQIIFFAKWNVRLGERYKKPLTHSFSISQ